MEDQKEIELKNCPFCNTDDISVIEIRSHNSKFRFNIWHGISICPLRESICGSYLTKKLAIEYWNTRAKAPESKLSITNEQCEELKKHYQSEECQQWMNAPMGISKQAPESKLVPLDEIIEDAIKDLSNSSWNAEDLVENNIKVCSLNNALSWLSKCSRFGTQQSKLVPLNEKSLVEIFNLYSISTFGIVPEIIGKLGVPSLPSVEQIEQLIFSECDKHLRKYNKIRTQELARAIHRLLRGDK